MADPEPEPPVYFAICNIPSVFRSADLRNYFSQFIESGGFKCFHFRHRPEILKDLEKAPNDDNSQPATLVTTASSASDDEDGAQRESEPTQPGSGPSQPGSEPSQPGSGPSQPGSGPSQPGSGPSQPGSGPSQPGSGPSQPGSGPSQPGSGPSQPGSGPSQSGVKTCCCVVSVPASAADKLVKMYSGNHWIASRGSWLARRCVIKRIRVSQEQGEGAFPYKTKSEQRRRVSLTEHFTENDLKTLSELNPPALMPNGNVGTPVKVFLQLIQSCRLPPRLIKKLGLVFPKTGSSRRYGNVPFHYQDTYTTPGTEETVLTAAGHEISGPGTVAASLLRRKKLIQEPEEESIEDPETREEEPQSDADDDDDRCEEWERHEALHEDVTSQDRTKERLFEEEIELKWEKGGPGLVFYTDAQYWQEEDGDFDEQTADDWDVDMSVYYDKDGGDMDARDFVRMRFEQRLRDGVEDGPDQSQSIGSFEKFTKGFGRRVMEKQGWTDGEGLGSSQVGMPDALENEGQHPHCKRGFGYHGEKLRFHPVKKPKPDSKFLISTKYDKPRDIDGGDPLLRRQPTTSMKYRGWQPGGSIGPKR